MSGEPATLGSDAMRAAIERRGWRLRPGYANPAVYVAERPPMALYAGDLHELMLTVIERDPTKGLF